MVKTLKDVAAHIPMPETLLKKKKRNLKREQDRVERSQKAVKARRKLRTLALKRAEQYAKEYKQKEAALENERLLALENGNFYVEPEAKLAFVIRIRGLKGVSPKCRKALQLLRLRQVNNGVFVRLNKATLAMLKLVEPYIAWGYPTLQTVRELVYKRGFANLNGQRLPLSSNSVIEKALRPDVICVEDVIHEISQVGPNFKRVNNFLWPFKLRSVKGGLNQHGIKRHFVDNGDFGNRGPLINEFVQKML